MSREIVWCKKHNDKCKFAWCEDYEDIGDGSCINEEIIKMGK